MDEARPSPQVALTRALVAAQGEIQNVIKDARNPMLGSTYATLAAIMDVIRPVWSRHGLALVQLTRATESGVVLDTIVRHVDGGEMVSSYPVRPMRQRARTDGGGWVESPDPQSMGSAMTYARRYCAAAIAGLAPEDDDANAATQPAPKTTRTPAKPPPKRASAPPEDEHHSGGPTDAQLKRLWSAASANGIEHETVKDFLVSRFGVASSKFLTRHQYDEAMLWIDGELEPPREPGDEG